MGEQNSKVEVMIIEDDELAADIYSEFISKLDNFKVTYIANTGEQALKVLKKHKPQLILLDVYLPDINGIELLWTIRKIYRNIDIILITASNEADTVKEAIRGGAFSYIIKPVMMNKFLNVLEQYEQTSKKLNKNELVKQSDLDSLFFSGDHSTSTSVIREEQYLPKGIDKFTLNRVKDKLITSKESFNANDFSTILGVSQSTARRYLEYLASEGSVEISIQHGAIGRPERRYRYKRP